MPDGNTTPTNSATVGKLKRSALAHFLKNPASSSSSPEFYLIGTDVSDASVDLSPDTETTKNILDETSITDNGYEPSMEVDTYYANPSDGWFYEWIKGIAMNRKTGDECVTQSVEVLIDKTTGPFDAWMEDVMVKPKSYGGPQGGVSIPFTIAFCGNRKQGTATISGKTLSSFTES